jgi:hypothetical protein
LTTPSRAPLTTRKTSRGDEDVEDGDVEAFEQSRRALPKILIALSRCRITEDEVPETCSPDRRCTPTNGMKKRTRRRSRQIEAWCASSLLYFFSTRVYL